MNDITENMRQYFEPDGSPKQFICGPGTPPSTSDTPRTDEAVAERVQIFNEDFVRASFARTLETELQQANARERDLKDELAKRDAELANVTKNATDVALRHVANQKSLAELYDAAQAELARLKANKTN